MDATTEQITASQTLFRAGDLVPDWVLTLEPATMNATRGEVRFNVDCDVFDLPQAYVLIPRVVGPYPGLLNISGTGNKLCAFGKDVRVCISSEVIVRDIWQSGTGPIATMHPLPPPVAPSGEQVGRESRVFLEVLRRFKVFMLIAASMIAIVGAVELGRVLQAALAHHP